jgi:hypothetical protein
MLSSECAPNGNPEVDNFRQLSARIWEAASSLRTSGEIAMHVDGTYAEDESFTLRIGNSWCRLKLTQNNHIKGSFGWFGPSFEVTAKNLFDMHPDTFENIEVMAEFVIVELLRALTDSTAICSPSPSSTDVQRGS